MSRPGRLLPYTLTEAVCRDGRSTEGFSGFSHDTSALTAAGE